MDMSLLRFLMLVGVMGSVVMGDIYLHVPRGSNNRLDEANRDRANGNRLFDSQNNNRGGYNVGSNHFVEGSDLEISWTNQHACGGNPNTPGCEVIFQMMCDKDSRDGTTTQTIPDQEEYDLDYEYGRHESYHYYQTCKHTERNKGLFTASQNLNGDSMRFTRQNPNGARRGYECPEERDYYPHWMPSPWMDIAILTNDVSRCAYYQEESQNVKARYYCSWTPPEGWVNETVPEGEQEEEATGAEEEDGDDRRSARAPGRLAPITEVNCTAAGGFWTREDPWGLPPPLCFRAPWTRDNHLGNTLGGYPPTFFHNIMEFTKHANFTNLKGRLTNFSNTECWMRIRYNITTKETPWNTDASANDRDGLALGLTGKLGYIAPFENNPQVDFGLGVDFQLAINTAQYGRTFQDRSHRMSIIPRDPALGTVGNIKNLVVQGKRGNIVQVFPGVEYDFMPNRLSMKTTDYLHAHWAGSNTNPNNNDGQGQNGSDRSNIAPLRFNDLGRSYPEWVNATALFDADFSTLYLYSLCATGGFGGELSELDDLPPYCDPMASLQDQTIGLIRPRNAGTYNYMCTRNNNFSNRGQKAVLFVEDADITEEEEHEDGENIGYVVGGIASGIIVSLLVAFAILTMGKSMGVSSSAAAAKTI